MVRQRPAKPCTRVRFPSPPPNSTPSAISSAGERFPDTEEVTGSIPVSRTKHHRSSTHVFGTIRGAALPICCQSDSPTCPDGRNGGQINAPIFTAASPPGQYDPDGHKQYENPPPVSALRKPFYDYAIARDSAGRYVGAWRCRGGSVTRVGWDAGCGGSTMAGGSRFQTPGDSHRTPVG